MPSSVRLTRLAAAVFAVAVPAAATAQDTGFTAPEAELQQEIARSGAPGVAVAVVRGDRVVYARGFGLASTETNAPVGADTLFQIGSATKMLTAAAVMSAHAAKAIDVDAPASRYVSGLVACVGAPTVRQLLSHTGGLMDEPDEFGPQDEEGLAAYPRTWTAEYCLLPPGRAFSYSNSGFALAGLALQEADKKPFADVMKARVLEPLGMARTTFRPTEAMTWPLAIGHRRDNAGAFAAVRPLPNDARLWPAGTVYSSAQEMARLVIALLNDGRVDGRQALPAGLAVTVRTAVAEIPTTGERYGLGQFLTERTLGHGGTMTGYTAQITIDHAAGAGVVVLSNGDNAALAPIVQMLLRAAGVEAATAPALPIAAGGMVPDLQGYVGSYRNPRRFTVEVAKSGDGLVLRRFGRDFPLRPFGPDRFMTDLPRGGTEVIAFGRGADGRADYLQMNVWALARVPAGADPDVDPRIEKIVAAVEANRLRQLLTTLTSFGTRNTLSNPGSSTRGIGGARQWILEELRRSSPRLQVEFETFRLAPQGRVTREVEIRNVVAVLPGRTSRRVYVTGHYDSLNIPGQTARVKRPPAPPAGFDAMAQPGQDFDVDAPGANDNGSGTVLTMELARVFAASGVTFDATLVFALWAAEEQGLLGSILHAQRLAAVKVPVAAVFNNDIVGGSRGGNGVTDSGSVRVFSEGPEDSMSRSLARYIERVAAVYVPSHRIRLLARQDRFARGSDHQSFNAAGFPAVVFREANEHYAKQHSGDDTLDGVDFEYLSRNARVNAAAAAALALAPPTPATRSGRGQPLIGRLPTGYAAALQWTTSPGAAAYRIYWRDAWATNWQHQQLVGDVTQFTLSDLSIDNVVIGVSAVGSDGHESLVSAYVPPSRSLPDVKVVAPRPPISTR